MQNANTLTMLKDKYLSRMAAREATVGAVLDAKTKMAQAWDKRALAKIELLLQVTSK